MTWKSAPARSIPPRRCALGPKRWNAAYVQPSRRPKDGRYGENEPVAALLPVQVILKPSPPDIQELYLKSLAAIGVDAASTISALWRTTGKPDARRVGSWLGMLVRRHGVSQFTYFNRSLALNVTGRGRADVRLERLACMCRASTASWIASMDARGE